MKNFIHILSALLLALEATGMRLAIILNFGKERLEYERLAFGQ